VGIDVDDSLLVGAFYGELEGWIENKVAENEDENYSRYDVVEEYFDQASPYYDSDIEVWFLGISIPNYQPSDEDWWKIVKEAAYQFELLTGVKAKIRGGANVW
jgi:hypothetical protein